ncbi:MAG: polyprenol phosphomannose-dependent alpha 1,6 mannosyltransferase MptB [Acidimicrobiales bacterium]|nr:polyprenol phosphomannose-dependent alpha 1,6 mannosyltransferase MptB [Acidimicrobiales bacterium]
MSTRSQALPRTGYGLLSSLYAEVVDAGLGPTAVFGLAGSAAIALGSSLPGSPFALNQPGAWFFGTGPSTGGPGSIFGQLAVYGGAALLIKVWFDLVRAIRERPLSSVRPLAVVFALWVLPLLVAPPLFSADIYSYAGTGDMLSHGISPYHYGPDVLGSNSYVAMVDPFWGNTPSPYGPLFLGLAGLVTFITVHQMLFTVLALRLLAVGGVALAAAFLPELARRQGRNPSSAFALAILNPLTLLGLVAAGHNDAIMVGLLVVGLVFAQRGRPLVGIALCTLATGVKFPAALGILYIAWDWATEKSDWRTRIRRLGVSGLVAVGVMELLGLVTTLGWGWLGTWSAPGQVRSAISPLTDVSFIGMAVIRAVNIGPDLTTLLTIVRALGLLVAAVICVRLLFNRRRLGLLQSLGLSLVVLVGLGPVLWAWYLTWAIVVLAAVLTRRWWGLFVGISILAAVVNVPDVASSLSSVLGDATGLVLCLGALLMARESTANRVRQLVAKVAGSRRLALSSGT